MEIKFEFKKLNEDVVDKLYVSVILIIVILIVESKNKMTFHNGQVYHKSKPKFGHTWDRIGFCRVPKSLFT